MSMTKCVICTNEIIGHGHNADPIAQGKCCDMCNGIVLVARFNSLTGLDKPRKEITEEDLENEVTCECCDKSYDYRDEPKEVKEGGTHICPDCWNEEPKQQAPKGCGKTDTTQARMGLQGKYNPVCGSGLYLCDDCLEEEPKKECKTSSKG